MSSIFFLAFLVLFVFSFYTDYNKHLRKGKGGVKKRAFYGINLITILLLLSLVFHYRPVMPTKLLSDIAIRLVPKLEETAS
jgi:hypothetical protein